MAMSLNNRWARRTVGLTAFLLAATLTAADSAPSARPKAETLPTLDEALAAKAPEIIRYLRGRDCRNVAVLKFLVDKGDGVLRDSAGSLNLSLADRLEVALVLADPTEKELKDNKEKKTTEMGIVTHASDALAASGMHDATHRTAKGRAVICMLGKGSFQRAWGATKKDREVQPDVFLTGEARLTKDLRGVEVTIRAFGRADKGQKFAAVCSFTATTDVRTLAGTGVRYVATRGGGLDPEELKKATSASGFVNELAKVLPRPDDSDKDKKLKQAAFEKDVQKAPVRLEIRYNGVTVNKPGTDVVSSPDEGTEVSFRLINATDDVYGVVLMVNGENTIHPEEKGEPGRLYKWVLDPKKTATIHGYQYLKNNLPEDLENKLKQQGKQAKDLRLDFRVLSPEESQQDEVYYGRGVGTVTLYAFRGVKAEDAALAKNQLSTSRAVNLISRSMVTLPRGIVPSSLVALKRELKDTVEPAMKDTVSRGLVGKGAEKDSPVDRVRFTPQPFPDMVLTVRYYQPKDEKPQSEETAPPVESTD
jgi:hypothetical protein